MSPTAKPKGGGVVLLHVEHAASCQHIVSGVCTCSPDYRSEPATAEAWREALGRRREWARERLS